MNGTLTIGPPGVSTPATVAMRIARRPPARARWREPTSCGISTCMRPASISAGTRRGRMNLSIEKPFFAPMSGSPGSFRYATAARTSASTTRTIVEGSTSGRIAAPFARSAATHYGTGAFSPRRRAAHDDFIDTVRPARLERRGDQGGPGRDHGEDLRRLEDRRGARHRGHGERDHRIALPGPARHDLRLWHVRRRQARRPQRARPADGQGDQDPAGARAPLSPEPQPQEGHPLSRLCVPRLCGKVVPRLSAGGGSSSGRTRGSGPRSGGSNPPPPANKFGWPHRLEAQDTALSRLKHGFESRWGHQPDFSGGFPARILIPPCRDQNPYSVPRPV